MSGHSKWHSIRHKKAIVDTKRGKIFSKVARLVEVAAREGADPELNYKLRLAIEKAREVNMPKENVDRAIAKGSGASGGAQLEEVTYEGFGPASTALLIEVLTDNRNRAASEVRTALMKHGGALGGAGASSWMFKKAGLIRIDTAGMGQNEAEELELSAIDAGAKDIKKETNSLEIYTDPKNLSKVKEALKEKGYEATQSEILQIPQNTVKIKGEAEASKILKLLDALEELDDVQSVASNFDIPDEVLDKLSS